LAFKLAIPKRLPSGPVRKPLQSLSGQEKKEVEQVLAAIEIAFIPEKGSSVEFR
jgi:dihydrodipicolinate synthase/N-acetylneuraminate lyase